MTTDFATDFAQRYLNTWTEPDAGQRRANIESLWAADGRLVVSPIGATLQGVEQIDAHIAGVYERQIVGAGMRFAYDQQVAGDDALLMRWSMLAADGSAVGRGVDVVFRDADGLVRTVYMFMGIN